jgi:hypothetical protein
MFKKLIFIVIIYFLYICQFSYAVQRDDVNILSWWGYFDVPWVRKYIDDKCKVNISFDWYYSNNEFLSRFLNDIANYDIVIFEEPSYKRIATFLPEIKNSPLVEISKRFNKYIYRHYKSLKLKSNVTIFLNSVTGVLWNENLISNIDREKNISNLLSKYHDKIVVMIDDPMFFNALFLTDVKTQAVFNYSSFRKILGDNRIVISNPFYYKIYYDKNFLLAYLWSGVAIKDVLSLRKNGHSDLSFTTSTKYSVASSDLVAHMNTKPSTMCVINVLTDKKFLGKLQNTTYYFSPYLDVKGIDNKIFKRIYIEYIKKLPTIKWAADLNIIKQKKFDSIWEQIKLKNYEESSSKI